ncbi:DEAD/DEAH box helicase, partial [Vibrio cholerae]|nr:DEAD/DEAH box helicase [Vibrio cholerae]EJY0788046.1 DEAD/DEAH box helicase [Vibrio cholerae]
DFKGATRLFADPEFDGEPVVIYEPDEGDSVVPPTNEPEDEDNEDESSKPKQKRSKIVLDDVDVDLAAQREQYLGEDGKLITEDYRVLAKAQIEESVKQKYATLSDFLKRWHESDRKQAIIDEMNELGLSYHVLQQAIPNGEELDTFDLIAHLVFDRKPLTRQERANNVKKRDVFGKYGEQAKAVLEALLDKFAENGVQDIENSSILEMPPFTKFGTKTQIRRGVFGDLERYQKALKELEIELYRDDEVA